MTIWLGPEAAPQTMALDVSAAEPSRVTSGVLHRGLGGRTQAVWTGTAPDAGQRLTLRCALPDLGFLLGLLDTSAPLVVSTDDPGCAVQTGTGVVRSTRVRYRYDLHPHAADVEVDMAWVA